MRAADEYKGDPMAEGEIIEILQNSAEFKAIYSSIPWDGVLDKDAFENAKNRFIQFCTDNQIKNVPWRRLILEGHPCSPKNLTLPELLLDISSAKSIECLFGLLSKENLRDQYEDGDTIVHKYFLKYIKSGSSTEGALAYNFIGVQKLRKIDPDIGTIPNGNGQTVLGVLKRELCINPDNIRRDICRYARIDSQDYQGMRFLRDKGIFSPDFEQLYGKAVKLKRLLCLISYLDQDDLNYNPSIDDINNTLKKAWPDRDYPSLSQLRREAAEEAAAIRASLARSAAANTRSDVVTEPKIPD